MAYTQFCDPYNSTPFSTCCGVASQDRNGRPDDHCHKCGEPMTHHDNGLPPRRPGHCRMCGKRVGNISDKDACHC